MVRPSTAVQPGLRGREGTREPSKFGVVQSRVTPGLEPRRLSWRGRRTLPRIGRDTRPPPPRRLMGAGWFRSLDSVSRFGSFLNHAHFLQTRRQHVLKESPQELVRVEFHRAPAPTAGLLLTEANASSIERDDARVRDRDTKDVAREVAQRRLAVADGARVGDEGFAPDGGIDRVEKAGAAHLALELRAQDDRQRADGDEEVRPRRDPALAVVATRRPGSSLWASVPSRFVPGCVRVPERGRGAADCDGASSSGAGRRACSREAARSDRRRPCRGGRERANAQRRSCFTYEK